MKGVAMWGKMLAMLLVIGGISLSMQGCKSPVGYVYSGDNWMSYLDDVMCNWYKGCLKRPGELVSYIELDQADYSLSSTGSLEVQPDPDWDNYIILRPYSCGEQEAIRREFSVYLVTPDGAVWQTPDSTDIPAYGPPRPSKGGGTREGSAEGVIQYFRLHPERWIRHGLIQQGQDGAYAMIK